ncbi:MAG: BrnT family toxin [Pseudomonas sp.]|uniref:BrnT family toxin n=1 Tax=Pseudomonas sp. TaxID=306 RepID=UPI002735307B|nr:BrnT family toxin [Pseudomonas sp.]MDP3848504.1 BrnT family toxin [Pseudomonas sp.]
MDITYDPGKNENNIQGRGLPFDLMVDFDWSSALIHEDTRKDYGERRYQALGYIGERLFVVVFTPRAGKVHVISLRKANSREVKRYA